MKADPENDENTIDFRWSAVQGEDKKNFARINTTVSF